MAAHENLNPDQLKMFMTPREIHSQYQPLDADREEGYRSGEWTESSRTTGGGSNEFVRSGYGQHRHYQRPDKEETSPDLWDRKYDEASMTPQERRYEYGGETPAPKSFDWEAALERRSAPTRPNTESSTAMGEYEHREGSYLNRKAEEHEERQYEKDNTSLVDSIRQTGVQSPVHLGQQFGSEGKPEIVGGHHRIAVATRHAPDTLIPVLHHKDIRAARTTSYPYT